MSEPRRSPAQRNANRPLRVAIVGGGIAGLTVAVALRKLGDCEVDIYERSREFSEVGAGLQMAPNAVKVIRYLGLEEPFRHLSAQPVARATFTWDDSQLISRQTFTGVMDDTFGAPYCMIHRADLQKLLLEALPQKSLHPDHECRAVDLKPDGVGLEFSNGKTAEADLVLGADGIHSLMRRQLFGDHEVRFTNQICWRLVLPIEAAQETIEQFSLPWSVEEYTGLLGPTGHVIMYPIRAGKLWNIFAGRVSEAWADEQWTIPSDIDEMLEAYAGWNPGLLHLMAQTPNTYKWGIHDRDPLQRWVQGRAALLGDAAHPMMPTLAQGAAITMEDAYVCAGVLATRNDLAPQEALQLYETLRRDRAAKVQLQARQQFINNQKVPPPPFLPTDWIYEYDAHRAISQSPASVA